MLLSAPTILLEQATSTGASSYNSSSISPSADRLVLLAVTSSAASSPPVPAVSGCSLTWTQVLTQTFGTNKRLTVFRAMGSSPTSGALTINFSPVTQTGVSIIVIEFPGVTLGGNGGNAIIQSAQNSGSGTSASATLAAVAHPNDGVVAFWSAEAGTLGTAFAPDGSLVELSDGGYDTPTTRTGAAWLPGEDTSPSATITSSAWAVIALEVAGNLSARANGVVDLFDRADSASLGGSWTESQEIGEGVRIVDDAVVARLITGQAAAGTAVNSTRVRGDTIEIAWDASVPAGGSDDLRLTIYARNTSPTGVGVHYRLEMNDYAGGAVLYRGDGTGLGDVVVGTVDIELAATLRRFRWRISNRSGFVRHEFYLNGSLDETIDDTAPGRITADGYLGFRLTSGDTSVGPGDTTVFLYGISADPLTFLPVLGGSRRIYQDFDATLSGSRQIGASTWNMTLGGSRRIYQRFEGDLTGSRRIYRSFDAALSGSRSFYLTWDMTLGGSRRFYVTFDATLGGSRRIANTDVERYELYRGENAAPDFDAAPWETFTSLPHTTTALTSGVTTNLVLRRRNRYGLISQNLEQWSVTLDGSGNLVATPPDGPSQQSVEPAAAGAIRVQAVYDAHAQHDAADRADAFLVYYSTDGSNPLLATPVEVSMQNADGRVRLDWTSGTHADGLAVRCVVRTRRSGTPDVDSANTAEVTTTTDTDGPAQVGGGHLLLGSVSGVHQEGVI